MQASQFITIPFPHLINTAISLSQDMHLLSSSSGSIFLCNSHYVIDSLSLFSTPIISVSLNQERDRAAIIAGDNWVGIIKIKYGRLAIEDRRRIKGDAFLVSVAWAHQMNKVYIAFDHQRIIVMACENQIWNVVNCIFIKSDHEHTKHKNASKMKIHSILVNNEDQLYVAASNQLLHVIDPYALNPKIRVLLTLASPIVSMLMTPCQFFANLIVLLQKSLIIYKQSDGEWIQIQTIQIQGENCRIGQGEDADHIAIYSLIDMRFKTTVLQKGVYGEWYSI